MAGHTPCETTRAALQEFLLGTLPLQKHRDLEAHLASCRLCQDARDKEQKRLARLNALPVEAPPAGMAERTLARTREPRPSYAGLVVAAALALVLMGGFYFGLSGANESALRASTRDNMETLARAFKMFANESRGGAWPALAPDAGPWVPDLGQLYGTYLNDVGPLISELHPDRKALRESLSNALNAPAPDFEAAEKLMGESFAYLGYGVKNLAEFETLYLAKVEDALPTDGGSVSNPEQGTPVVPLRDGVERFLITDINNPAGSSQAQSTIPVLIEIATWKYKKSKEDYSGANVLYMDGHVEFVRLGTFPVVEPLLNALAGLPPTD